MTSDDDVDDVPEIPDRRRHHLPPALGEIAQLINTKRFPEADEKLSAIEKDLEHPAWNFPIVCIILRDRITKERTVP